MWLLAFAGVLGLTISTCQAEEKPFPEYQVKAACLVKFLEFVKWPDGTFPKADTPYRVGVLGPDPYGANLDQVAGRPIGGRKVIVTRGNTVEEMRGCHLVVISPQLKDREKMDAIVQLHKEKSLTVGDKPGFVQEEGMIEMLVEENKVRFRINEGSAKKAGLKIDSRLLGLAKSVIR